ncbi:unnamed protein product, partial [Discosporangium mesarthrocarpum]
QLAPPVQLTLALYGALYGWQYGLIRSVTPLAEADAARDLNYDAEVQAIRDAATTAAAAATPATPTDDSSAEDEGGVGREGEG